MTFGSTADSAEKQNSSVKVARIIIIRPTAFQDIFELFKIAKVTKGGNPVALFTIVEVIVTSKVNPVVNLFEKHDV